MMLIPLAVIGAFDTIREDFIRPESPAFKISYWLPGWTWRTYGLIGCIFMIMLILESAYRAIKKRDDLMRGF
jgi:hypothetical protein